MLVGFPALAKLRIDYFSKGKPRNSLPKVVELSRNLTKCLFFDIHTTSQDYYTTPQDYYLNFHFY